MGNGVHTDKRVRAGSRVDVQREEDDGRAREERTRLHDRERDASVRVVATRMHRLAALPPDLERDRASDADVEDEVQRPVDDAVPAQPGVLEVGTVQELDDGVEGKDCGVRMSNVTCNVSFGAGTLVGHLEAKLS